MNAEQLYAQFREHLQSWRSENTHWVGIASGGAWLAYRLQQDWNLKHIGVISSAMHRDDYLRRGTKTAKTSPLASSVKSATARYETTDLPFDVTGSHIVLLDDVLYTGRTIRAVLNELFDYGRPASVRLAVLVDRGGRELPLQSDFSACKIEMDSQRSLQLVRSETGLFSFEIK